MAEDPVVVVIAGMHRSGTSFVASALQAAGLPVGERLLTDFPGNPRGHFEDVDFLELHEAALAGLPEGSFVATDRALGFDAEHRERAARLVATRGHLPLWGFKDPRTTLFLDEWRALLPRARWVFVYRHPLEVLVSILRRGINRDVLAVPELGLRIWQVYNQRVLAFRAAHPADVALVSIDAVAADVPAFVGLLATKLGVRLDPARAGGVYQAEELRKPRMGPRAEQVFVRLYPDVAGTLARLDAGADLARPVAAPALDPPEVHLAEAAADGGGAPALACLLAAIAAETWARVPDRLLAAIRELEHEQRKLGAEWFQHRGQLERQAAYVEALEAERARLTTALETTAQALADERALPTWKRLLRG